MKNRPIEGKSEDEMWAEDTKTGVHRLVAYWDDELECYIYLSDKMDYLWQIG